MPAKVLVNHARSILTILVNISGIAGAHYPEHETLQADCDLSGEEAETAYYEVTEKTSNGQYGITTGSGIRQYGNFTQVEAVANEGYLFKGWYREKADGDINRANGGLLQRIFY